MLAQIRRIFAHSWIARIMAAVLAVAFGAWGIQGALTGSGPGAGDVATVRGGAVSADAFDNAYRRALDDAAQSMAGNNGPADPSSLPPQIRREVAQQVLRRLVTEQVLVAHARTIGLSVPDAMLREAVFAIPAFRGSDGTFDRQRFDQLLQANHLTETRLLALVRDEMLTQGLIDPVRAGVVMPAPIVRTLFDYAAEQRSVAYVQVRTADMPAPPPPDEAVLRRFQDNHPKLFTVPEYRTIRVVVLSPETVSRDIHVSEEDIKAEYAREEPRLHKPARRSVEVATVSSEAQARALLSFWQNGGNWAQVQALAEKDGGTAVALSDASEGEFPSKALGAAVFAAADGGYAGPVKEELGGFAVLRVTGATAASGDYASMHDQLRDKIAEGRASSTIADRVDRLQDAIAGGGLDRIPADLGAAAAEGTLDAQGMTKDATPAPLPGTDAMRQAIANRAFAELKGAPPELVQGPGGGWFAVEVTAIEPAHRKSFAEARADVLRAWTEDAQRHAANESATRIYTAARSTHTLDGAGLPVQHPAPFGRNGGGADVPPALVRVAFGLKQGDAAMVGTTDGFAVGVLESVVHPTPASEQTGYDRLSEQATAALGNDLEIAYAAHLTDGATPRINEDAVRRVVGP